MRQSAVLALVVLGACAPSPTPSASATAASAASPAPASAAPASAPAAQPMTFGSLTEEQFRALHAVPLAPAARPKGQTVTVGGAACYLSLPASGAGAPGLTVIHEWWGLNDHIKLWCDRLAAEGYAALAVDLYDGAVATTPDEAMAAMKAVDPIEARTLMLAAHAFLRDDPRVKAPKRGSIGWCFGGGQSLQLALHAPDLDACVLYYGQVETDPAELSRIGAAVLAIFGTQDESLPQATVDAFDAALEKAGVRHEILRFDAPHAFANPSNPHYDQVDAAAAWEAVRAFLAGALKPASH